MRAGRGYCRLRRAWLLSLGICGLALHAFLIAQPTRPPDRAGKTYVLVIGTNIYNDRGLSPLKFATNDAKAFSDFYQARAADNAPLLNENVAAIRKKLQTVLLEKAQENDTVLIFISARGLATSAYSYGFILGSDSKADHPLGSALTTDELNYSYIHLSRAKAVILFADLCRGPADGLPGKSSNRAIAGANATFRTSETASNQIQQMLHDLQKQNDRLAVFSGSRPGELSLEDAQLGGGHGVFAYYLVSRLRELRETPSIKDLRDYLATGAAARKGQTPEEFGKLAITTRLPPPLQNITRRRSDGRRFALVNHLRPIAFDNDDDDAEAPASQAARLLARVENAAAPHDLQLAIEQYQRSSDEVREFARDAFEVMIENAGQSVLNEYGEGDQFPGDKTRPGRARFELAAEAFRLARELETAHTKLPETARATILRSFDARYKFCQARSMLYSGQYDEAEKLLRAAAPDLPLAYNALGIAELEQKRHDTAIGYFNEAIKPQREPDWAYARHNLALTYIEKGDNAAAEREYREAIRRTPYQPYLYYNLGTLYQRTNRKSEAEAEYRTAIAQFDEQRGRFSRRAAAWEAEQRSREAAAAHERERVLRQNEAQVFNALGALYQSGGKTKSAIENYQEGFQHDDTFVLPLYNLGVLHFEAGKGKPSPSLDVAIQEWERVLRIDAKHVPTHLRLGEAYSVKRDYARAIDQFQLAESIQGQPIAARALAEARGDLARSQGKNADACREYTAARDPRSRGNRMLRDKLKATCN